MRSDCNLCFISSFTETYDRCSRKNLHIGLHFDERASNVTGAADGERHSSRGTGFPTAISGRSRSYLARRLSQQPELGRN